MISTILAAIDHTHHAPGVLRTATEVASRFGARLFLLRALDVAQAFPPAASTAAHRDPLPEFLREEARRELVALAEGNPIALAHPPILKAGPAARAILEAAAESGADLLVLGSHELHGLDHVLGTTTGSVVGRARCHVLVVHVD